MTGNIIESSPEHGAGPSVLRCICCGKDYGVTILGKLKEDKEAPGEIFQGLCNDCEGVSEDFKERNHLENSIMYMTESAFTKVFGGLNSNKQ